MNEPLFIQANAGKIPLPDESVQCVVTSPPYYGLRMYDAEPVVFGGDPNCSHEWDIYEHDPQPHGDNGTNTGLDGGTGAQASTRMGAVTSAFCLHCNAWRGQLGLEPTPELFIEHLVDIFREVRRVLRSDGTLWLNMGDSYANDTKWGGRSGGKNYTSAAGDYQGQRSRRDTGFKPKDLMLMPSRVAIAMQEDGWWVRSRITWVKGNPMPESVRDRPTQSTEDIYLLTKSARYFYDAEAVREPAKDWGDSRKRDNGKSRNTPGQTPHTGLHNADFTTTGRNQRNAWHINTTGFPGSHFAVFPPAIPERCIKAGTSERGACPTCGAAWVRVVEKSGGNWQERKQNGAGSEPWRKIGRNASHGEGMSHDLDPPQTQTLGFRPACDCYDERYFTDFPRARSARKRQQQGARGDWLPRARKSGGGGPWWRALWPVTPCVVLDPFSGSGTTALVAEQLGRRGFGLELSAPYIDLARERYAGTVWKAQGGKQKDADYGTLKTGRAGVQQELF